MTKHGGFSLIELLVAIAIVGLLVALTGFGVRGLLDRGRLSEGLALVNLRANEARLESKRTDQDIDLSVFSDRIEVDGRAYGWPAGVQAVAGGGGGLPLTITFEPPFGTYAGLAQSFDLTAGGVSATTSFVGALARVVVAR